MKLIWRHLRRLRARWRLHRMEWDALHRPLEPPPGYERFHTLEAVFPGLRDNPKPPKDWAEFKRRLRGAWKLYKHDYISDPEITEMEARWEKQKEKKRYRVIAKLHEKSERFVDTSIDKADEIASDVVEGIKEKKPAVQKLMKNRVAVLQQALNEFSEGYSEAVSGRRTLWGETPYEEAIVQDDNRPVMYEVENTQDDSSKNVI